MYHLLLSRKLDILNIIKANLKVPHLTLVAVGISAAITAITVGIFAMMDNGNMFGMEEAEAARKTRDSADKNIWGE